MSGTPLVRFLTWICVALALIAIVAFVLQSWQLVLVVLGVVTVARF